MLETDRINPVNKEEVGALSPEELKGLGGAALTSEILHQKSDHSASDLDSERKMELAKSG